MADITARWAGACVVLRDGCRLGWRVERGGKPGDSLNSRYFGGHPAKECRVVSRRFDDPDAFAKAERWCAGFPAHADEGGRPPSPHAVTVHHGIATVSTSKVRRGR